MVYRCMRWFIVMPFKYVLVNTMMYAMLPVPFICIQGKVRHRATLTGDTSKADDRP
jgi:hypothetical protein